MKKLVALFVATLLLSGAMWVGKAQAYSVGFDYDGGGDNFVEYSAFHFKPVIDTFVLPEDGYEFNSETDNFDIDVSSGSEYYANIFTVQYTDLTFSEKFVVELDFGVTDTLPPTDPEFENLFVEIELVGVVDLINNIFSFNDGSATIFQSTDAFNPARTSVADLDFSYALSTTPDPSLTGGTNYALDIDLAFIFNTVYEGFWSTEVEDFVDQGFLVSFASTGLARQDIIQGESGTFYIPWQLDGGYIEFAVPEPSTVLLMGFGILGLAAVGRRRKN